MLSTVVLSGCFIVVVSVMGRIYLPRFHNGQKHLGGNQRPQSSHTGSIRFWSMDSTMVLVFFELIYFSLNKGYQLYMA